MSNSYLDRAVEEVDNCTRSLDQASKWDKRFLELARHVASWSKDPSTQVGAVLVRPDKTIAATGYNGFPQRMHDFDAAYNDREHKYSRIIHAEMNAIHFCKDQSMSGYTLYVWPMMSCDRCSVHVIQAGITRVVATSYGGGGGRWAESIAKSIGYFKSCDVKVQIFKSDKGSVRNPQERIQELLEHNTKLRLENRELRAKLPVISSGGITSIGDGHADKEK